MRRMLRIALSLTLIAAAVGCGGDDSQDIASGPSDSDASNADNPDAEADPAGQDGGPSTFDAVDSNNRTDSPQPGTCRVNASNIGIKNEPALATTGPTLNSIVDDGEYLWIVESGSNTVSRYHPGRDEYQKGFVDVGNGKNPYDIAVPEQGTRVFITNYEADSITVADRNTGEVVQRIRSSKFAKPSDITVTERAIYVTNVNYEQRRYGEGSVTVISRQSFQVAGNISTANKNPQYIETFKKDGKPHLLVVNTGKISYQNKEVGPASVEIWTPSDKPLKPDKTEISFPEVDDKKLGAPGYPAITPEGRFAYLSSSTAPVLFKLDLKKQKLFRGPENPIRLYQTDKLALDHVAAGPNGFLYVTAFNKDALHIVDTNCDEPVAGPISIGQTSEQKEGPHALVTRQKDGKTSVYYLMSLANSIGRTRVDMSL